MFCLHNRLSILVTGDKIAVTPRREKRTEAKMLGRRNTTKKSEFQLKQMSANGAAESAKGER